MERLISLHAEGSYTRLRTTAGAEHLASLNLHRLELALPPGIFFRCHRSHIINLSKVLSLDHTNGYWANLAGGVRVAVSRRAWPALRLAMHRL